MANQAHVVSSAQLVRDDNINSASATVAHKEKLSTSAAARPIPRISIQAFCEAPGAAAARAGGRVATGCAP